MTDKSAFRRRSWPLLVAVLMCAASPLALADDPWPPYPRDTPPRRKAAQPAPPAPAAQPLLRPMDAAPGDATRGGSARVPDDAPQYGTPYGEPGAAGSDPGNGARDGTRGEPARDLPPPRDGGRNAAPVPETARGVERGELLAPVMAADGSELPLELWRGLDIKTVETLIARIEIPPRSPAIHDLWRRLITSNATPPAGEQLNTGFDGIRGEVLYRSGLLKEAAAALANVRRDGSDPVLAVLAARSDIAAGNRDAGCAAAKAVGGAKAQMPKPLRAEAIQMLGYCAASAGNPSAAGLAADLARDEGVTAPGLALLDAVAAGSKPNLQHLKAVGVVDYRLLELAKAGEAPQIVERAQPALLAMLASDGATAPPVRLAAAEAAARLNAIPPETLAEAYRALGQPQPSGGDAPAPAATPAKGGDALARAGLFRAIEIERTPLKKVRMIRSFLDEAKRGGFYLPALRIVAKPAAGLQIVPEIGWFAETGAEIALAAGDFGRARAWASFGSTLDRPGAPPTGPVAGLAHWLALADIADPAVPKGERGRDLPAVEHLAMQSRFTPDQLHRIATVLDALDYNVPMKLWEAASRTPQPTTGHLPATGVLSQLQDASKKKEFGRTVLLAMDTLGPHGAEGAHIIALGDSIRALRRAGLDRDARRLGFEALFAAWPRSASN